MGKLKKISLVLLLLVLPLASERASMPVPAVVMLGGGELVQLEVEIKEGNGQVYVATDPLVGIQTQDSARTAFEVATELAGVDANKYDALVRLKDHRGTRSVDGPSGGAAMSLLMLSLLENKTLRQDLTITGTILPDGFIGEVGGVGEKTKAAVASGMRVILVPKNYDMFDKMVFSILGSRWNITIIEVLDIGDAEKLAFTQENVTLESNVMEIKPRDVMVVPLTEVNCTNCHIEDFKALAARIIGGNQALLDEVRRQNRSEFSYFLKMIEIDLEEAENAERQNYVYSGANSAFLTGINLNFLKDSDMTYDALRNRMVDVENCVKNTKKPQMTDENFEWVAGGDERLAWAKKKLREIENHNYSSDDDETTLFLFKELLTAESWCKVSRELFSVADKIGGTPVDESRLKRFTSSKIAEADSKLKSFAGADFGDAGWRFEAAKEEFDNASFAAAIFDSEYLTSTIMALNETEDANSFFEREFNTAESWSGMWAALYGNHARYIYMRSKEGAGGAASSIILRIYANSLNSDTIKMNELFRSPNAEEPSGGAAEMTKGTLQYQNELALLLVVCLIVAIFLNLIQIFKTAE